MPLVQIIPYVADQFDPGLYVFDGGTFNRSDALVNNNEDRAYGVLKDQTFNINEMLVGHYSHIGIGVFNKATVRKDGVLKGIPIIYLTDADWEISFTNESVPFLLSEEVTWDIGFSNANADGTIFSRVSENSIQNSLGQSPINPVIIDSKSSVTRIESHPTGYRDITFAETMGGNTSLVNEAISLRSGVDINSYKLTRLVAPTVVSLESASDKPMIASQKESRTLVDLTDISIIITIIPVTPALNTLSDPLQFTM